MIKYLNGKDYPIEENKFAMSFQGGGGFASILNKMFPTKNKNYNKNCKEKNSIYGGQTL